MRLVLCLLVNSCVCSFAPRYGGDLLFSPVQLFRVCVSFSPQWWSPQLLFSSALLRLVFDLSTLLHPCGCFLFH